MKPTPGKLKIKSHRKAGPAGNARVRPERENWYKRHTKLIMGILGALVFGLILSGVYWLGKRNAEQEQAAVSIQSEEQKEPEMLILPDVGLDLTDFRIEQNITVEDRSVREFILENWGNTVPLNTFLERAGSIGLFSIDAGTEYLTGFAEEEIASTVIIVEQSPEKLFVFNREENTVHVIERNVEYRTVVKTGLIKDNLRNALEDAGVHYSAIPYLEHAFKWTIDFYYLTPGDRFKLVLEEQWVDEEFVKVNKLLAGWFKVGEEEYSAFLAEAEGEWQYFDSFGRSMRKPFLMAPVEYVRVSRAYNSNPTLHPVDKVNRPHYGTDYAAPIGTPIFAVSDGRVIAKSYTSGNGNFVKLDHGSNIQTQYLHMNAFADGLRMGDRVKQGQVIGFVGETGKTTGPHVCFRFWKDGRQVNHMNEISNTSRFVYLNQDSFLIYKESLQILMNEISVY